MKKAEIIVITMILAFCSLLYELMLAQTLSTTMGNTVLRYNVTIGIYIASLGLGSLVFYKIIKKIEWESLVILELILAIIGGLGPILVLLFDSFAKNYISLQYGLAITIFNHFLIILVGFLSGLELPLLIEFGKKIAGFSISKTLAIDYVGTFIAAIIFPIFLTPNFYLFGIAFFIALLNLFVAMYIFLKLSMEIKPVVGVFLLIQLITFSFFLFKSDVISQELIQRFYL